MVAYNSAVWWSIFTGSFMYDKQVKHKEMDYFLSSWYKRTERVAELTYGVRIMLFLKCWCGLRDLHLPELLKVSANVPLNWTCNTCETAWKHQQKRPRFNPCYARLCFWVHHFSRWPRPKTDRPPVPSYGAKLWWTVAALWFVVVRQERYSPPSFTLYVTVHLLLPLFFFCL